MASKKLGRPPNHARAREWAELRAAGYTYQSIADRYGVTRQAVHDRVQRWLRLTKASLRAKLLAATKGGNA